MSIFIQIESPSILSFFLIVLNEMSNQQTYSFFLLCILYLCQPQTLTLLSANVEDEIMIKPSVKEEWYVFFVCIVQNYLFMDLATPSLSQGNFTL